MSHYRDPLAGLRSQVETKRAVAESRARALSPVVRAMLPAHIREAMTEATAEGAAAGDTVEGLSTVNAALDTLLLAYDDADAITARLREFPDDLRQPPPCRQPPPWLIEESAVLALRHALARRLAEITPHGQISRWGDIAYIARFTLADAPFAFVVKSDVLPSDGYIARFEAELRTSVPEALPPLVVKSQRPYDSVRKALGMAHEIEVGEPAFDEAFWIEGSTDATAVLTSEVRSAMRSYRGLLTELTVGNEVASITWQGRSWNPDVNPLPQFAIDVLLAVRQAAASA